MRQYRSIILSAVVYLVWNALQTAGAQTRTITLEDAVRLALEKNQELAVARLETDKSHARVSEAWSNTMPSISFEGTYMRAIKKPVYFFPDFFNPSSGKILPIEMGTDHSVNLNFTARQILFNSAVIIGVGASRIYADAAHESYRAKKGETIAAVRKAFYAALLAEEVRVMMLENLKNAEDNVRNVELLSKQGLVSEYDQLRAQVGLENLRPAVLQAENGATLAIEGLRGAIGLDVSESISISGQLSYEQLDDAVVSRAVEEAMRTNPTLSALKLAVDVSQAYVNVARSDYFPTLAAFGNFQYQAAKNDFRISTNDFIKSSTVGLSLTMNIFQGFQTNARVEQAVIDREKAREQLSAFEAGLKTGVHSLVLQLHQAQKRVEAQGRTVEQAQRGYKIASSRFANGSGTQLEVNDAQLALTQARVNRMQAIYDYLVASADLEQSLGILPPYVPSE
ncbi:MAG: TolC family protein [Acidobacteriota bacterium]